MYVAGLGGSSFTMFCSLSLYESIIVIFILMEERLTYHKHSEDFKGIFFYRTNGSLKFCS